MYCPTIPLAVSTQVGVEQEYSTHTGTEITPHAGRMDRVPSCVQKSLYIPEPLTNGGEKTEPSGRHRPTRCANPYHIG